MVEAEVIPKEIQQRIRDLDTSDITVGIPTFNNASTVQRVVRTIEMGLHEHFPDARFTIINSDGGSRDGTTDLVSRSLPNAGSLVQVSYRSHPEDDLSVPGTGMPGRATALRQIFQASRMLHAKACAVIDAGLQNLASDWIRSLIRPVFDGKFDLVTPYYTRHKFDGAINSGIIYPLIRALYGRRIRYPIGDEFCFSPALLEHYLKQDMWEGCASRFGICIWMITEAICGGFRTAQVSLGPKSRDTKEPAPDLSETLAQILGPMFMEMEKNVRVWQRVRGSEPVPLWGGARATNGEPVGVDVGKMIDSYDLGYKNLFEIWSRIMPPATLMELKRLTRRGEGKFQFPDETWVHVIYDFAVSYHLRTMNREHLLKALTPLYLGWIASFMLQMQSSDAEQVEGRIEQLCLRYEAEKPYLISRWRWPDRFNP
jgi:hypothetical protein